MKYDKEILDLQDLTGFIKKYYEFCVEFSGERGYQEKAYESVERLYEKYYERRKYSSYESFRECKNRKFREKSKNTTML